MEESAIPIELWKLIVTSVILVFGWWFVHWLAQNREIQSKRREVITGYLIEAYRNIENGCGRGPSGPSENQKKAMEKAIGDIQLFGSTEEIKAAKNFAETMNKESYGDPRELLALLRNDLRKELKLPEASSKPEDIIHWRLK